MKIFPAQADSSIVSAAGMIRQGAVVAVPTDTFYGLAADPFNVAALARLLAVKGRDEGKGILLLISQPGMIEPLVSSLPEGFYRWRLWPGAVTFLLPARPGLPLVLTGGTEKIGVRLPDSPIISRLCDALGQAVTGTSANRTGSAPAACIDDLSEIAADIDAVIDAGRLGATHPSTIVDVTGPDPVLVRAGVVPFEKVRAMMGR